MAHQQTITLDIIEDGLYNNIIEITTNPYDEIVAQIGEYWFYFDSEANDECIELEDYLRQTDTKEISEKIYDTLDDMRRIDLPDENDEYNYYLAYLNENL